MLEARGQLSPHQVDAEVGPLIRSATSSGQTTSKRSNTARISSSISNPSRVACPSEIGAMGIEPPVSRTVPLPLIPGERLVDLGERLNRYLGGSADEPWTTYAVKHDDEIAEPRCRLATFPVVSGQAGRALLIPPMTRSASSVAISGLSPNDPTT